MCPFVKEILEESNSKSDAQSVNKTRDMYAACMDLSIDYITFEKMLRKAKKAKPYFVEEIKK